MNDPIAIRWDELRSVDTFTHPGAWHCHRHAYSRMRDDAPELGDDVADDRRYAPDVDGFTLSRASMCDMGDQCCSVSSTDEL